MDLDGFVVEHTDELSLLDYLQLHWSNISLTLNYEVAWWSFDNWGNLTSFTQNILSGCKGTTNWERYGAYSDTKWVLSDLISFCRLCLHIC